VLARLTPQVGTIAISANQNMESYAALGHPVWPDDLAGFEGPLAGLKTGLRHCSTPYLLTVPCDSPFLPGDLAERLYAALVSADADLALAETLEDGQAQPQPVFALMKTTVLPHLTTFLASGGRRMDGWYGAIKVVRVRFDDASGFRNINTLQELQQIQSES
jgi:molybdenum cofactor guanylyltransferase